MLPPDVEPITRPSRGDGYGVTLLLFGAFGAGAIGFVFGLLIGWGTL